MEVLLHLKMHQDAESTNISALWLYTFTHHQVHFIIYQCDNSASLKYRNIEHKIVPVSKLFKAYL